MSLLDMSIAGGVVILAVIVVRALGINRLPKATFTVLWTVALLRLLVPAEAPSAASVYNWLTLPQAAETAVRMALETVPETVAQAEAAQDLVPAAVTAPGMVEPATVPERNAAALPAGSVDIPWRTLIWAAGALSCAGVFAEGYLRTRRRFREAVPVEDGFVRRWQESHPLRQRVSIRLSGRVKTPVTYGVFRPVILLSAGTDWKDEKGLGFVLTHEYGHIRRLDGLRKLALAAAVCLHWFNPLVWAMLVLANRDMEMACDELVVRSMDGDRRADYARTLIRMEEDKAGLTPLVSHFSANAMEERITSIMKIKKITALAVTASLLLTLGVTAVFATSAPEDAAETQPDPVPYDWGEAVVIFPLTEEGVEKHFENVGIQWWEPEDFAAWAEEQKPLLKAAVGSTADTGTVAWDVVWTEERSEEVLAAYEDIAQALKDGTGKLSKTVGGSEQVVVAVGVDWPLDMGSDNTARGYDVEALMWGVTDGLGAQTYSIELESGQRWVDFGPSQTSVGLFGTVRAYFQCLVNCGVMAAAEANGILQNWWSLHQQGDLPSRLRVVAAAEPTPSPIPTEDISWAEPMPPVPTADRIPAEPATPEYDGDMTEALAAEPAEYEYGEEPEAPPFDIEDDAFMYETR